MTKSRLLGAMCASIFVFISSSANAVFLATSIFTEDGTPNPPGDSITIANLLASTYQIDSITIGLTNSSSNVVFDPDNPVVDIPFVLTNTTGDAGFLGTPIFSDGFLQTIPDSRTVYRSLTLNFNDFDPGEEILINVDLDSDNGTGGFISGSDFAESELLITFTDGINEVNRIAIYESISASSAMASTVPVPAAVWLFGSGLLGLIGISRRRKSA